MHFDFGWVSAPWCWRIHWNSTCISDFALDAVDDGVLALSDPTRIVSALGTVDRHHPSRSRTALSQSKQWEGRRSNPRVARQYVMLLPSVVVWVQSTVGATISA